MPGAGIGGGSSHENLPHLQSRPLKPKIEIKAYLKQMFKMKRQPRDAGSAFSCDSPGFPCRGHPGRSPRLMDSPPTLIINLRSAGILASSKSLILTEY